MRSLLKKLLQPAAPPRRFGTVSSVLLDGRYVVVDSRLRSFTVDGDSGWLPGDKVIIQNGRIVARGQRRAVKRQFRV